MKVEPGDIIFVMRPYTAETGQRRALTFGFVSQTKQRIRGKNMMPDEVIGWIKDAAKYLGGPDSKITYMQEEMENDHDKSDHDKSN